MVNSPLISEWIAVERRDVEVAILFLARLHQAPPTSVLYVLRMGQEYSGYAGAASGSNFPGMRTCSRKFWIFHVQVVQWQSRDPPVQLQEVHLFHPEISNRKLEEGFVCMWL